MQSETKAFNTVVRNVMSGLEYQFNIEQKYTILQGKSATGKTTLIGLLDLCTGDYNSEIYTIESEYSFGKFPVISDFRHLSEEDWIEIFDFNVKKEGKLKYRDPSKIVFYCDETYAALESESFQKALAKMDYNCLIVFREYLSNLPYGTEHIYEVVNTGGKKHILQCKYPDNFDFPQGTFSLLKTEDVGSGEDFFAEYLQNVESAGGKNNIALSMPLEHNVLYVADSLGFGSEIEEALNELKKNPSNGLWLVKSFECKAPCELSTKGDKFEVIMGKELANKLRIMFGDRREESADSDWESAEDIGSLAEFTRAFK